MHCPLKLLTHNNGGGIGCDESNCAWWCSWASCCAIATIPELNESYMLKCMSQEINRRFGKKVD